MKDYSKKSVEQIVRMDGKGCFVEAVNNAFSINKVLLRFYQYDESRPSGSKFTGDIPIYLDIPEFLAFCHSIEFGAFYKKILAEKASYEEAIKKGEKKFPQPVYMKQGGTSAKTLAMRSKSRADGMSEARLLKLVPGLKSFCVLQAEKGPGQEDEHGLIIPRFAGYQPEQRIMIPFATFEDLVGFVEAIKLHLCSYVSAGYVKGEYTHQENSGAV